MDNTTNTKYDFGKISMTGRFAYSVMCAERYALAKYPEKDWKPLFSRMWNGTNDHFDEWWNRFMEILPEYLYEFSNYIDSDFEYLSEEDYNYYSDFLRNIDSNMKDLLTIPCDIAMIYAYTPIPGAGEESIDLINKAIMILKENNIKVPDPKAVEFTSFHEKNGWGENFDGTTLSIILR